MPAIATHLEPYQKAAEKRFDKGDFWWELRACDYYNEFEQPKLVFPNICKRPEFTFDDQKKYTNQKCFVITKFDLGFLGVLNSSLTYFLFDSILPKLRGDFYEPSYVYLKDFPIMNDESGKIEELVTEIFESKKMDQYFDPSILETEIDGLVYELYGLTEEEIRIVEGKEA